jgi:hypothetical protein
MTDVVQCLPEKQWLELGQAMLDKCQRFSDLPTAFTRTSTAQIQIGRNLSIEAGGRTYGEGIYILDPTN